MIPQQVDLGLLQFSTTAETKLRSKAEEQGRRAKPKSKARSMESLRGRLTVPGSLFEDRREAKLPEMGLASTTHELHATTQQEP